MMYKDLSGQKFGRLIALQKVKTDNHGLAYWLCKCECGNEKVVRGSSLRNGSAKSCGCYSAKNNKSSNKTSGTIVRRQNVYEILEGYVVGYTNKGEPFMVDNDDFEKIKEFCWHKNSSGYLSGRDKDGERVLLHRLIMNASKGEFVDHISHNTTDNRKSNLRICTRSQNGMNKKSKGYTWDKRDKKWRARITVNGKSFDLGYFNTESEAKAARLAAEQKYFGEFAYKEQNEKSA